MARKLVDREDDAPPDVEAEPVAIASAKAWREVALFVCERCGQEKRGQAHLDMVCRACHEAPAK